MTKITEEFEQLLSYLHDKYGADQLGLGPLTYTDKTEIKSPGGYWIGRYWETKEGDIKISGHEQTMYIILWRPTNY